MKDENKDAPTCAECKKFLILTDDQTSWECEGCGVEYPVVNDIEDDDRIREYTGHTVRRQNRRY